MGTSSEEGYSIMTWVLVFHTYDKDVHILYTTLQSFFPEIQTTLKTGNKLFKTHLILKS